MSDVKNSWRVSFEATYHKLTHHYGAAFLRTGDGSQHKGHANHWQRVLHDERIRSEEMLEAVDAVIKCYRFRTFPPNPAEFVAFVYQLRAKKQYGIPDTEEAYQQACGALRDVHPLVSYVRSRMGSWHLRTQPDRNTRGRFIAMYEEAAESLARGLLQLPESSTQTRDETRKVLSAGELSSRLDRLLTPHEP